jgi:hypothetical protein
MQKLLQRAKRRMESRTGASFLIAIVFFMLCFFVGATVLAAASANGGRLKAKTEQQQQSALQQRSAAQLLQSQLKLSTNARNRLNVVTEKTTVTTTTNNTNGATEVTTSVSYAVTFTAPEAATGVQRILYEAAARCYLQAFGISATSSLTFTNFSFGNGQTQPNLNSFFPLEGNLSVTLSEGGTTSTLPASYSMTAGAKTQKDLASFTVLLGDEATAESALSLYMKATISPGTTIITSTDNVSGNVRTDTAVETTEDIITWADPVVRKGGASA